MRQSREMSNTPFVWLFDPRMPFFFVLGGLLLAVMGNAAYDLLLLWLGAGFWAVLGALLGSVVLLALVVLALYAVLHMGQPTPVSLGPEEKAEERRGLVLFLSTGEGKADEEALCFHADLKYAWFIITDQVQEEGKAGRLISAYRKKGVDVIPLYLKKPSDAGEAYHLVEQALVEAQERDLTPGDLYVDITGCLRPSAVEATKACLEAGYDIEYVLARYDDKTGRVIPGTSQVMEVAVRPAGQKMEES
jgi:hypothetical protein